MKMMKTILTWGSGEERWIEVVNDVSTRTFSSYKEKSDNRFLKTPQLSFAESIFSKVA